MMMVGISSVATSSTMLGASVVDDDADKGETAVTTGSTSSGAKVVVVDVEDIVTVNSSNVSCLVVVASTSSTSCSTSVGAITVDVSSTVFRVTIIEDNIIFNIY